MFGAYNMYFRQKKIFFKEQKVPNKIFTMALIKIFS